MTRKQPNNIQNSQANNTKYQSKKHKKIKTKPDCNETWYSAKEQLPLYDTVVRVLTLQGEEEIDYITKPFNKKHPFKTYEVEKWRELTQKEQEKCEKNSERKPRGLLTENEIQKIVAFNYGMLPEQVKVYTYEGYCDAKILSRLQKKAFR